MRPNPVQIAFADLTHTGQVVASNTLPLGVLLVASYASAQLDGLVQTEIFKYPEDFSARLDNGIPDILCFSNFSWNIRLAYRYAEMAKVRAPKTVIIFGGPNYPLTIEEQEAFLNAHPAIDFYVWLEGEIALTELAKRLIDAGMNADALKKTNAPIPSVHYLHAGKIVRGEQAPRLSNLAEIPSPYLSGLADKFLDDVLIPMIQTNRGCPYQCTFCTEGQDYYNKVHWSSEDRVRSDLEYMASRTKVPDLIIVDSNFGMFKQDLNTCNVLAELQKNVGWPRHIHVSAGKNRKDRVLEAASIVNGAINLSATIQSIDPQVLANVKRRNISTEQIVMVGKQAEALGANSYSEIIVCLPGDTREAHFLSVATMVDVGINFLRMYQLMMLPGSEMSSTESRLNYAMETRYRVLPRCFGNYPILGESVPVFEIEEICIANATMSYSDYLDCRELNLSVELFYNSGVFRELISLLEHFGIKPSAFLIAAHERGRSTDGGLGEIYTGFRRETDDSLWPELARLESFLQRPEAVNEYLDGTFGSNELFKYRAAGFFHHQGELHDLAFAVADELLTNSGHHSPEMTSYLDELKLYCRQRKANVLETATVFESYFTHDFSCLNRPGFRGLAPRLEHRQLIRFFHPPEQCELVASYVRQYGTTLNGLGRILLRSHVNKLYRQAVALAPSTNTIGNT